MTNRIVDFPDSYTTGTTPTITDPNLTAHLNDTTDAHDASAISNVPSGNLAATDVQAALNELQGDIDSLGSGAVEVAQDAIAAALAAGTQDGATLTYNDGLNKYDLTNTDKGSVAVASHEFDVTAHPASSIVNTPSGNLAATEVQAALNELQSDIDTRATSASLSAHTGASSGVHGVTGSVVGTSDSQALTNKDIDGGTASNTSRITIPKDTYANLLALTRKEGTVVYATDTDKVYYDDGSTLRPVGSGSGGGINFLPLSTTWSPDNTDNVDAEISVGQWVAFADAASATPTDLTGGSPNVTIARTTTAGEILNGNASFEVTKTAANRQGEGVSCLFNVPPAYQGKLCQIKIPYKVVGTIATGDVTAWIYDVTNSLLITPLANNINQASGTLNAFFTTTPSAGTPANQQYRIGIYFGSTSTNAQSIYFDDVSVGPVDIIGTGIERQFITHTASNATLLDASGELRFNTSNLGRSGVSTLINIEDDVANTRTKFTALKPCVVNFMFSAFLQNAGNLVYVQKNGANLVSGDLTSNNTYNSVVNAEVKLNAGDFLTFVISTTIAAGEVYLYISAVGDDPTPVTIINPNIGPWNELTASQAAAAWTGWTTVTAATARWRQVGECIEYEAKATLQTGAATEARHALPSGFTSASNYDTLHCVGFGATTVSGRQFSVLIEPSKTYFTFGDTAANSQTKQNTNALIDPGPGTVSLFATVRVQGLSAAGVINAGQVAYIREEQTSGTNGGTFTSGSYATRTLNTITTNNSGVTLSANQITIPKGQWKIEANAPAFACGRHKAKLYNVTDASDVLIGSSEFTEATATDRSTTRSFICGTFTISSQKTFEIRHRCEVTSSTTGFGVATSFSDAEVYTQVTLTKLGD